MENDDMASTQVVQEVFPHISIGTTSQYFVFTS